MAIIGPLVFLAAPAVNVDVEDVEVEDVAVAGGKAVPLDPLAKYLIPDAALVALAIRDDASEALSVTTAWP